MRDVLGPLVRWTKMPRHPRDHFTSWWAYHIDDCNTPGIVRIYDDSGIITASTPLSPQAYAFSSLEEAQTWVEDERAATRAARFVAMRNRRDQERYPSTWKRRVS